MIYISTSCTKHSKIIDSIRELNDFGSSSLELSGGTKPYIELDSDLIKAKENLGVDLLLHNYFPPPSEDFVLNLGAANDKVYQQSLEHAKRAIGLSTKIGASKYAFHAGFYIDIKVEEIGKKLSPTDLTDKSKTLDRFCEAHEILVKDAGTDVKLYVENNVFSKSNYDSFEGVNPLMLTSLESYKELQEMIDFNLLLDVAHLKVSCQTLNGDFEHELNVMFNATDYIHVSDNDGTHDTNRPLLKDSLLYRQLSNLSWENKTTTLEVYEDLDLVKTSLENLNTIVNA